jgi:hypothetical protein
LNVSTSAISWFWVWSLKIQRKKPTKTKMNFDNNRGPNISFTGKTALVKHNYYSILKLNKFLEEGSYVEFSIDALEEGIHSTCFIGFSERSDLPYQSFTDALWGNESGQMSFLILLSKTRPKSLRLQLERPDFSWSGPRRTLYS